MGITGNALARYGRDEIRITEAMGRFIESIFAEHKTQPKA
jgi:hypothetical protein